MRVDGFVLPARCSVEVTFRVHDQMFLMRPDKDANERLLACFGRAYDRYPELFAHALSGMGNHGSFLATPDSTSVLSSFMRDFESNLARRTNRARGRRGRFVEKRYKAIPIVDEPKLEERLRYLLTQGTKENLVWSANEWPGVTSIRALQGGPELVGHWRDLTAEYEPKRARARRVQRARERGDTPPSVKLRQAWRSYPITLHPLPHWRELPIGEQRARVAEMVREDDVETRRRHELEGTRPLGVAGILRQDPFSSPKESDMTPAPPCHSSTRKGRSAWRKASRAFVKAFRERVSATVSRLPVTNMWPCTIAFTVPSASMIDTRDREASQILSTGPPSA